MNQQAVKVLPFLRNCSIDPVFTVNHVWANGDLFKDFRFGGPEHRGDPSDARDFAPERQVIEFSGLGEVDGRHAYIR